MIKTKRVGWVIATLTTKLGLHSGSQTNPVKPVIEDFVSFQNTAWKKSVKKIVKIMNNKTVKKVTKKQLTRGEG